MSIYIRCQWLPAPEDALASRLSEMARVATTVELVSALGPHWFQLGRSRKDALKEEVPLGEVHTNRKLCRRVPLIEGEAYWALDVWNGRPEEEAATYRFSLFEPSTKPDILLISTQPDFLRRIFAWRDVLSITRRLTEELGGHAVIASTELDDEAEKRGIANAEHAAYGAFWGVDRSGRNPLHRWLATAGRAAPFEIIACDSWEDVNAPADARLRGIAECRAAVAAEAAEAIR